MVPSSAWRFHKKGFTRFVLTVLSAGGTENGAEEQGSARSVGETEAAAYGATLAKAPVQVGRPR